MIRGGYILQPRCFDESEAAHMAPAARAVWFYLLRTVNHAPYKGVDRGQRVVAYSDIMEGLHWMVGYRKETYTKDQIAKALRTLRERFMIATVKTTRGMLVTVCNYDVYQSSESYEDNSESTTKATRTLLGASTIYKNEKNERTKEESKPLSDKPDGDEAIDHFKTFWKAYPKKKGKGTAEKAWKKIKRPAETLELILTALDWQLLSADWVKENRQFVPNPATYLNSRGWEDEEPEATESKPGAYDSSDDHLYLEAARKEGLDV